MRQLIVIFEYNSPANNANLAQLQTILRTYRGFAFLTSNSCIVWSNDAASDIRNILSQYIGSEDKLYVGETSAPAAWFGKIPPQVSEYLIKNLKGPVIQSQ